MAQFVLVKIDDKNDDVVGNVYMQENAVDYVRRALDAYQDTERVSIYQVRASESEEPKIQSAPLKQQTKVSICPHCVTGCEKCSG